MKAIVFSLVSLAASAAMAFPAVKDKAVFNGIYAGGAGGQIEFVQTLEIISIDAATGKYKVSNVFQLPNGQTQSDEMELNKSDLLDRAQVQGLLANCASNGGVLAQTTVPAGTFTTCQFSTNNGGSIWIADAPFGFVKQISIDEEQNKMTTEMASFVNGQ